MVRRGQNPGANTLWLRVVGLIGVYAVPISFQQGARGQRLAGSRPSIGMQIISMFMIKTSLHWRVSAGPAWGVRSFATSNFFEPTLDIFEGVSFVRLFGGGCVQPWPFPLARPSATLYHTGRKSEGTIYSGTSIPGWIVKARVGLR